MTQNRDASSRDATGRFAKTLQSAERDAEACRLRSRGMTYQQISDQLGYGSHQNAYRAIKGALAALPREHAEELRRLELAQLDYLTTQALAILERSHLTVTATGRIVHHEGEPVIDDGPTLQALDRLLRIQARRAKLMRLDTPAQPGEMTLDDIDAAIEALTDQLARDQAGEPEGTAET